MDVPYGATVDPATVSPPGCWTELPVSLPTAMGLERRRPRLRTPLLSVLAVFYLLRSVKDEKQPGALPTSR